VYLLPHCAGHDEALCEERLLGRGPLSRAVFDHGGDECDRAEQVQLRIIWLGCEWPSAQCLFHRVRMAFPLFHEVASFAWNSVGPAHQLTMCRASSGGQPFRTSRATSCQSSRSAYSSARVPTIPSRLSWNTRQRCTARLSHAIARDVVVVCSMALLLRCSAFTDGYGF